MENKITQKIIPEGWKKVNLGEISKIYDGTHQTPDYVEQGVPFYSVEHITSNNFTDTKYISENVYQKENKRVKVEKGDVLMSRIGDIGTAKYIDWEVKASFYVTLALIKCSNKVNGKFLAFLINSAEFKREIWRKTIHVAFPNKINLGDISTCESIIPPLFEQNRIVAVLETWDQAIETLKLKIEVKKEIKKGLMQELLTGKTRLPGFNNPWKIYKLTQITSLIKDGTHATHMNVKNGIPLLSAKDIVDGNVITNNDPRLISQTEFEQIHKSYRIQNGDLLLCLVGSIGRVALTRDYKNNYTFQRSVGILRFKNQSPEFFFQLMQASNFQKQLKQRESRGAQGGVYLGELGKINIKIPEFEEQSAIAEILEVADKEIYRLKQKLTILKDQKKYLLNNLVTGTIRTPEIL